MAFFGHKAGRSILNLGFLVGFIAGILSTLLFTYTIRTTPRNAVIADPNSSVAPNQNGGSADQHVHRHSGENMVTLRPPVMAGDGRIENIPDHHHEQSKSTEVVNHDDIEKLVKDERNETFHDQHQHQDNAELAIALANSVRILCWVMTSPDNHQSRAKHIQATWGKRCNKLIFVSEKSDSSLPILEVKVEGGREHLTAKTMKAFDHIYEHHFKDADWFMKADDDTYVVVENLRYFLSSQNSSQPVFFGHHFKVIVKQGYFSGGGGYVLSKEALRRFGLRGKGTCNDDHGAEDVEMGSCMEKLGVAAGDSRDALGRSRFHCFDPVTHVMGGYPDWYYKYDKYGARKGIENVSDYAITFHYLDVNALYGLEFYIYHLRPYGLINGPTNLNRNNSVDTSS